MAANYSKEMTVTSTLLRESIERNDDYILPDYISDIKKLVRCEASPVIHNTFNNGNSIQFEGEIIYNIIVICDDSTIKNIIFSSDFNFTTQAKADDEFDIRYYADLDSVQARITSPRKISCKGRLNIFSAAKTLVNITPEFKNDHETSCNTQELIKNIDVMQSIVAQERDIRTNLEVELTSNMPEISNIVYCKVDINISEVKLQENKLIMRGETKVSMLYETPACEYRSFNKTYPYSEYIQNGCDKPCACICNVKVKDIKITVENNSFGEMRIANIDFCYDIEHKYYYNKTTALVNDIYSVERNCTVKHEEFEYNTFSQLFSSPLSVTETKELPDDDYDLCANTLIDSNINVLTHSVVYDKEKNKHIIQGELQCSIICMCESSEKDKLRHISYVMPYKYEKEAEPNINGEYVYECNINVTSKECELEKGKLHINAELYINCVAGIRNKADRVTAVEFTEACDIKRAPITVYYPTPEDTLWGIAKRYKVKIEDIVKTNSLSSESIENVKVLILPK